MLTEAGQQNPGLLQRLAEQITSGTIGGTSAALLAPWLKEVAAMLGIAIQRIL